MQKKRTPRKAAKEVWPGAGLALDWETINADDFQTVEIWLEGFHDTRERLDKLDTLTAHFEYECDKIIGRLQEEDEGRFGPMGGNRFWLSRRYTERARAFGAEIRRKKEQLAKLYSIEKRNRQAAGDFSADAPPAGKWTNEQAAIALYALLRAAGAPDGLSGRAVGDFAQLLTGRSAKRMAEAQRDAAAGSFTDEAAKTVADALTKLGLPKVAADVQKKFRD